MLLNLKSILKFALFLAPTCHLIVMTTEEQVAQRECMCNDATLLECYETSNSVREGKIPALICLNTTKKNSDMVQLLDLLIFATLLYLLNGVHSMAYTSSCNFFPFVASIATISAVMEFTRFFCVVQFNRSELRHSFQLNLSQDRPDRNTIEYFSLLFSVGLSKTADFNGKNFCRKFGSNNFLFG